MRRTAHRGQVKHKLYILYHAVFHLISWAVPDPVFPEAGRPTATIAGTACCCSRSTVMEPGRVWSTYLPRHCKLQRRLWSATRTRPRGGGQIKIAASTIPERVYYPGKGLCAVNDGCMGQGESASHQERVTTDVI
jgi:hypothetical protein